MCLIDSKQQILGLGSSRAQIKAQLEVFGIDGGGGLETFLRKQMKETLILVFAVFYRICFLRANQHQAGHASAIQV